ncbi:hypothetical protein IGJ55_002070 [Enterococcus sp. AZ170]|uniref:ComEA family DNA-binding protein n=1 Tax=Enterococcus sp. AZ170 TaxID=2774747 RepID=UPI003D2FB33D
MNKKNLLKKGIFALLLSLIFVVNTNQVAAAEKVDINNASHTELQKISGVGSVIAKRIIEARPYSSLDQLRRVKGIGDVTLQKIKQQELAYVLDEKENDVRYTVYYYLVINLEDPYESTASREIYEGKYIFDTKEEATEWIIAYELEQKEEGYFAYYVGVSEY